MQSADLIGDDLELSGGEAREKPPPLEGKILCKDLSCKAEEGVYLFVLMLILPSIRVFMFPVYRRIEK